MASCDKKLAGLNFWASYATVPIRKTATVEDIKKDLRPVSLTPKLSNKVCDRFVTNWLIEAICDAIDKRQFGSIPNFFTSHALISLINHLLKETGSSGKAVP